MTCPALDTSDTSGTKDLSNKGLVHTRGQDKTLIQSQPHCTRDYMALHPWTASELAAGQMEFRTRRIEWEKERQ